MIPELGHFAVILALLVAIVQGVLPLLGAHRNVAPWMAIARPAAQVHWLMLLVASGCLAYSFLTNDFSVVYVAEHSNSLLPAIYRFSAFWGGHEGSLLLWVFLLATWTLAVSLLSRSLPESMVARVLGVLGLVSSGLLLFILLTSSPFERLLDVPADGRDLNPLLQDPGLVFHPPMLYMGYVGFSVAFAFAIAALLSGQLDAAWARWSRPWTVAAWTFLTLGIALGSWWAYYELGWGGWWFWDPVENASFMPWLIGTALIHSLAVTEKRGAFKNWTVLLAIGAFSLSLLGTFLVRSGVLTSVHAFATDPRRGIFILIFLVAVIGSSLLLFAWRAPKVGLGGRFALFSRETLLLLNNLLLLVACGAVLLGTLYPLIIDALGMGKLSVGPPYFQAVFVPLMVPLLFLTGVGALTRWKHARLADLIRRLWLPLIVAILAGIAIPLAYGHWTPLTAMGVMLAVWIAASGVVQVRIRAASPAGARSASRSFWGMQFAHLGIAVFVFGVTMVKGFETEKDVRMEPSSTVTVGGYTLRLLGVREVPGPNYRASMGDVELTQNGVLLQTLHPEKRAYESSGMPMTEAAINTNLVRDVYVSLGEPVGIKDGSGAWSVRVHYKPFVVWVWGGCLLMALGGLLAVSDRRYRLKFKGADKAPLVTDGVAA